MGILMILLLEKFTIKYEIKFARGILFYAVQIQRNVLGLYDDLMI